jgi:hypothetical protein
MCSFKVKSGAVADLSVAPTPDQRVSDRDSGARAFVIDLTIEGVLTRTLAFVEAGIISIERSSPEDAVFDENLVPAAIAGVLAASTSTVVVSIR